MLFFYAAGLLMVCDICGSGCSQQEQANPLLSTTQRVSLPCEYINQFIDCVHLLNNFNKTKKSIQILQVTKGRNDTKQYVQQSTSKICKILSASYLNILQSHSLSECRLFRGSQSFQTQNELKSVLSTINPRFCGTSSQFGVEILAPSYFYNQA